MPRLMLLTLIAFCLSAPIALAQSPYQLESKLEQTTDRIVGTFKITKTSGPNKGELVSAPRLTMNDGNIGKMTIEVAGTNHKLDIRFIKAKDAPHALVIFLVWDGKTIIQAETRRLEPKR